MATSLFVDRAGLVAGGPGVHFAVAPSGRTVVFAGSYGGSKVLYRRDLDRVDPEPIVGTEGGSDVFFSHDGRSVGFEMRSELWTASLDGGTPQMLLPNQPLRGGTWGEGDRIVVGRVGSGLWMASATGGEPRQLTTPSAGRAARASPDAAGRSRRAVHDPGRRQTAPSCRAPARDRRDALSL